MKTAVRSAEDILRSRKDLPQIFSPSQWAEVDPSLDYIPLTVSTGGGG